MQQTQAIASDKIREIDTTFLHLGRGKEIASREPNARHHLCPLNLAPHQFSERVAEI